MSVSATGWLQRPPLGADEHLIGHLSMFPYRRSEAC
jgi:hypothetical protein